MCEFVVRVFGGMCVQAAMAGMGAPHRMSVYESPSWYYLIASDVSETSYSVLKIDRCAPVQQLSVADGGQHYTKQEIAQLLSTLQAATGKHHARTHTLLLQPVVVAKQRRVHHHRSRSD
jgi:hypothetical protein